MKRKRLKLVSIASCGLLTALLFFPAMYTTHVEDEFRSFMERKWPGGQFQVEESRCVGKPSAEIRLLPIARSKINGEYPFLGEMRDPVGVSYMQCMYYHGYWFNYCKLVQIDGKDLIAYWSIKEDIWHLGQFTWTDRRMTWNEM